MWFNTFFYNIIKTTEILFRWTSFLSGTVFIIISGQLIYKHMENKILIRAALSIFIVTAAVTFMIIAKEILIPLAISFFLVYLLYPLVWRLERIGINRGILILIVLMVAFVILGGLVLLISVKLSNVSINLSVIKEEINLRLASMLQLLEHNPGISNLDKFTKNLFSETTSSWETQIGSFFASTTMIIFQIVIIPFYTFFLLFYRTKTAYLIFRLVGRRNKQKAIIVLRDISTMTNQYLTGEIIVILILSVLISYGPLHYRCSIWDHIWCICCNAQYISVCRDILRRVYNNIIFVLRHSRSF